MNKTSTAPWKVVHGDFVGRAGEPASPEYQSWQAMRSRCNRVGNVKYKLYGGRGIRVCASWSAFANFLADMGPRPPGTTLDRINSDGNYEPGNCRWATHLEQRRNRRDMKRYEYAGKRLTLHEIAKASGVSYYTIRGRMYAGTPLPEAAAEVSPERSRPRVTR